MEHGGKREGAGRKPVPNPKSVIFKVRLTEGEHETIKLLGGGSWVRKVMAETVAKTKKVKT